MLPTDLGAVCLRWWDAGQNAFSNDGCTVPAVDGDNLHGWICRNNSGYKALRDTSGFATYKTNVINGLPVARYVDGSYFYLNPATAASTTFTVIAALKFTGTTGYHNFLTIASRFQLYARLANHWGVYIDGADRSSGIALDTSKFYILSVTLNSYNDIKMWTNGGSLATNTAATAWETYGGEYLGRPNNLSFQGDLAEIAIFNTVLSDGDRQGIEQYLNAKYAIFPAANGGGFLSFF